MRLKAEKVPYSSVVGGGLVLTDETGRARFQVAIFGTDKGITKEETAAIGAALANGIPVDGIEIQERT
jgi:hypothetical protein